MRVYTGIGARKTPQHIQDKMSILAKYLYTHDWTLRSGGADGADSAFESGAGDKKVIYLPHANFNRNDSPVFGTTKEARIHASLFHPNWPVIGDTGRNFMGRNSYQVLGLDLRSPTEFVLCWTPKGKITGGTGQALRVANHYKIPVYNLAIMENSELEKAIFSHLKG